jgi:hypothetical protein
MYSNHKASRKVSRRAVLGTAAGAGIVGAGAAVGIVQLTGGDDEATASSQTLTAANADTPAAMNDSPVVIYVSGDEVRTYLGEAERVRKNNDLANRLRQEAKNI